MTIIKNKTLAKGRKMSHLYIFCKNVNFYKEFPSETKTRSNVCSANTTSQCLVKENEIFL